MSETYGDHLYGRIFDKLLDLHVHDIPKEFWNFLIKECEDVDERIKGES